MEQSKLFLFPCRLPRTKLSSDSAEEDLVKYDVAYKTKADCAALFPSCLKDLDVS
jgi:hypothetical protein